MVERLWAGWRIPSAETGVADALVVPEGKTLFEALLASELPDDETYIVWQLRRKDRQRINRRSEMNDRAHSSWHTLDQSASDRGLATYRLLTRQPRDGD